MMIITTLTLAINANPAERLSPDLLLVGPEKNGRSVSESPDGTVVEYGRCSRPLDGLEATCVGGAGVRPEEAPLGGQVEKTLTTSPDGSWKLETKVTRADGSWNSSTEYGFGKQHRRRQEASKPIFTSENAKERLPKPHLGLPACYTGLHECCGAEDDCTSDVCYGEDYCTAHFGGFFHTKEVTDLAIAMGIEGHFSPFLYKICIDGRERYVLEGAYSMLTSDHDDDGSLTGRELLIAECKAQGLSPCSWSFTGYAFERSDDEENVIDIDLFYYADGKNNMEDVIEEMGENLIVVAVEDHLGPQC